MDVKAGPCIHSSFLQPPTRVNSHISHCNWINFKEFTNIAMFEETFGGYVTNKKTHATFSIRVQLCFFEETFLVKVISWLRYTACFLHIMQVSKNRFIHFIFNSTRSCCYMRCRFCFLFVQIIEAITPQKSHIDSNMAMFKGKIPLPRPIILGTLPETNVAPEN